MLAKPAQVFGAAKHVRSAQREHSAWATDLLICIHQNQTAQRSNIFIIVKILWSHYSTLHRCNVKPGVIIFGVSKRWWTIMWYEIITDEMFYDCFCTGRSPVQCWLSQHVRSASNLHGQPLFPLDLNTYLKISLQNSVIGTFFRSCHRYLYEVFHHTINYCGMSVIFCIRNNMSQNVQNHWINVSKGTYVGGSYVSLLSYWFSGFGPRNKWLWGYYIQR